MESSTELPVEILSASGGCHCVSEQTRYMRDFLNRPENSAEGDGLTDFRGRG